jgi:hypothetical protein
VIRSSVASIAKLLSVGLTKQNAESVIRGYKGPTLYTEPAARALEDFEAQSLSWRRSWSLTTTSARKFRSST